MPASAKGGGALNRGRGGGGGEGEGEGSRGGLDSGASALPDLREGGGGGGAGPRFGANGLALLLGAAAGGGGGGGALMLFEPEFGDEVCSLAKFSCSSRMKFTIKSWSFLIKSSVNPLSLRSCPKCSLQSGSNASSRANSEVAFSPFEFE